MHILIAPNAFKNSLGATEAANAIRSGLEASRLRCSTQNFPVGDGGDGTAQLIVKNQKGIRVPVAVIDPLGRKITTEFGVIDAGNTAVVEMADASGLRLIRDADRNPLHYTSYGTGQLVKAALDRGVHKIILGLGGSATIDGGCGILQALGMRFLDRQGKPLRAMPEDLTSLHTIDTSALDQRLRNVEFVLLCDVDNKLLGAEGAATVFGPQKGATAEDIIHLEKAISRLREVALHYTGKDMAELLHGGAAGGVAAGLQVFLGARLVKGIDYFLELTGFDRALENADLVITGEGSLDRQTLQGKAPFGVAQRAKMKNVPVIAFAGQVPLQPDHVLRQYFDVILPIANRAKETDLAVRETSSDLYRTAFETGNLLAISLESQ